MRCKEANIKPCLNCSKGHLTISKTDCWLEGYKKYMDDNSKEDVKAYFIRLLFYREWIFYFRKAVELYHPEYLDMVDKILILK
jgi:hypothetical protein